MRMLQAGIGVWWGDDHELNVSMPVEGNQHTNNVAEIQAAHLMALLSYNILAA